VSDESERYHDKKAGILFYHVAGHEEDVRISQIPAHRVSASFADESAFEVNIPACALLGWAATQVPDDALSVLRDLVALADDEDGKKHAAEWFARSNAIMARTRALVAEHTTNEERND